MSAKLKSKNVDTSQQDPEKILYTEVPSCLKQLARYVVRSFYSINHALIIDMLVRNACVREEDLEELLRFEKKQLRACMSSLRSDKFVQVRMKMETLENDKLQMVNFYFINYNAFVNMVKYKLDIISKRLETAERDAVNRASFCCLKCKRTFTDLEADQLFDMVTEKFSCTVCSGVVEEDTSSLTKNYSRLTLARYNQQLKPLYDLLIQTERVQLAPELLDPKATTLDEIRGIVKPSTSQRGDGQWSGEATRHKETNIEINLGGEQPTLPLKSRPIWLSKSAICPDDVADDTTDNFLKQRTSKAAQKNALLHAEITTMLLIYERPRGRKRNASNRRRRDDMSSDSSDDDSDCDQSMNVRSIFSPRKRVDTVNPDPEEYEPVEVPMVYASGETYPIDEINKELIGQMTPPELKHYFNVYQDFYADAYDAY